MSDAPTIVTGRVSRTSVPRAAPNVAGRMKPRDRHEPWGDLTCECGRPKRNRNSPCRRCSWLDAGHTGDSRGLGGSIKISVIAHLRLVRELTLTELAEACGSAPRAVLHTLQCLERAGRVARRMVEVTREYRNHLSGKMTGASTSAWAYRLTS